MMEEKKILELVKEVLRSGEYRFDIIKKDQMEIIQFSKKLEEPKLETEPEPESMENQIRKTLMRLRVPASVKGYNYLKDAVLIVLEDENKRITKVIYPEIAKKYRTTPSRVERAIRHAIELSWANRALNPEEYQKIFGFTEGHHLTNSQFIFGLAEYLRIF